MNQRKWKEFITKRSTIWTLSLCVMGVIVLGSTVAIDNSRNAQENSYGQETDASSLLEEALRNADSGDTASDNADSSMLNAEEPDDFDEVSGSDVQGTAGEASENEADSSGNTAEDGTAAEASSGNAVDDDGENTSSGNAADDSDGTAVSGNTADSSDGTAVSGNTADSSDGIADTSSVDADGQANSSAADEQAAEASSSSVISEQVLLENNVSFDSSQSLLWPSAGTIAIDYSMDQSVLFPTLNQYRYNPALIISSETGNQVLAAARGIVESISVNEETGTTLVLNIGNGYLLTYGQLKEPAVSEGDVVEAGDLLAYISEPTRYYSTEGSNLYFKMTKDGTPVDPVLYLE